MKVISETVIMAPLSTVFDALSDIEKIPERLTTVTKVDFLSKTKTGIGTRWIETRKMYGSEHGEEMEITTFSKDRSYTVEADTRGVHYVTNFDFEQAGSGTKVTLTFTGKPMSATAKLTSFMSVLMMGSIRKVLDQDLADMKKFCEGL